jgi:hypothetical protein
MTTSVRNLLSLSALLLVLAASATAITWTTIDFPGSDATVVSGINTAGDMAGWYTSSGSTHGFVLSGGTFTTVDYLSAVSTQVIGINDNGDISGQYYDGHMSHAFLGQAGTLTTIDPPGARQVWGMGLNNADDVVGFNYDQAGNVQAFKYSAGNFTQVKAKGQFNEPAGINNNGNIAGTMFLHNGAETVGYVIKNDVVHALGVVGSAVTLANGVNDHAQVVGWASVNGIRYPFIFASGKYVLMNVPGSDKMAGAYGINNAGSIVGTYTDSSKHQHGFLRTK